MVLLQVDGWVKGLLRASGDRSGTLAPAGKFDTLLASLAASQARTATDSVKGKLDMRDLEAGMVMAVESMVTGPWNDQMQNTVSLLLRVALFALRDTIPDNYV